MRKFIVQSALFLLVLALTLTGSVLFVPSPEMRQSLLCMAPVKVALLRGTPSPKIIFVGGSNLSMGLNSQPISETFGLPVVNMGLHGGLGLAYMMEEVRPYVRKGDILVLTPEYSQLYSDNYLGNIEVMGVVFDVMPEKRKELAWKQWWHLTPLIPNYAAKKLFNLATTKPGGKTAAVDMSSQFNTYGDFTSHWDQVDAPVVPLAKWRGSVNFDLCYLNQFERFVRDMQKTGARVLIAPPCFQATSFDNIKPLITRIESELHRRDLPIIATMSHYRMDDALCSGTPYHLNIRGVDIRTSRLIQDLSEVLKK